MWGGSGDEGENKKRPSTALMKTWITVEEMIKVVFKKLIKKLKITPKR